MLIILWPIFAVRILKIWVVFSKQCWWPKILFLKPFITCFCLLRKFIIEYLKIRSVIENLSSAIFFWYECQILLFLETYCFIFIFLLFKKYCPAYLCFFIFQFVWLSKKFARIQQWISFSVVTNFLTSATQNNIMLLGTSSNDFIAK